MQVTVQREGNPNMTKYVSQEYIDGILEGRAALERDGMEYAHDHLDGCERLCRKFDAQSPVGQMLRGERDFWRNRIKKANK